MSSAPSLSQPLSALGSGFLDTAQVVGGMGVMASSISSRLVRGDFDRSEMFRNLHKMAVRSVPLVVVTALFVGGIMVIQAAPIVQRYGAQGLLGWGAGFSVLREIGPLLTALMLSGRIGANNTAELGTMVVTEQIDALRALAIDPVSFLIVPRLIGIVITLFVSTLMSDALALLGAAYAGLPILSVEPMVFYNGLTGGLLSAGDVFHGLIKSVVFGIIIALTSCQFGIATSGGAPGVGRAVNAAVVVSAAGIFIVDYFVSFAIG